MPLLQVKNFLSGNGLPISCAHSDFSLSTLDSGINVALGINVAHGTFGKNIKSSP